MVVAGPDMFTYDYNADGIRTTKTVNGVKHTYALSGTTILNEEWTENGVQHLLMYVYDANGSPVGMVYRNSTMDANASEECLFVKMDIARIESKYPIKTKIRLSVLTEQEPYLVYLVS